MVASVVVVVAVVVVVGAAVVVVATVVVVVAGVVVVVAPVVVVATEGSEANDGSVHKDVDGVVATVVAGKCLRNNQFWM